MRINRLDHVALEIDNMDRHINDLSTHFGMRVLRRGERHTTKQRIAMVGDGTGFKLELIETAKTSASFVHLAFDVDDVDAAVDELVASGWTCRREAHDLDAAHARTALMSNAGIDIQLIAYQPTSPDTATWTQTDNDPAETGRAFTNPEES